MNSTDTTHLISFARTLARHMTALADDLEALNQPRAADPPRCGDSLSCQRPAGHNGAHLRT